MRRLRSALLLVLLGFGRGLCCAQKNQPDLVERVRQAIIPVLPGQADQTRFTDLESIHDEARNPSSVRYFNRRYLFEITFIEGQSYRRLVEMDGKPLKGKAAKQEQERFEAALKKRAGFGYEGHAEPDHRTNNVFGLPLSQLPTRFQLRTIRHGAVGETSAGESAEVIEALPYVSTDTKLPGPVQRFTLWIAGDKPTLLRFQYQFLRDEGDVMAGSEGTWEFAVIDGSVLVQHSVDHMHEKKGGVVYEMTSEHAYSQYRRFTVKSRLIEPEAEPRALHK